VQVAAAALAHGRLRGGRNLQLCAALKTGHPLQWTRRFGLRPGGSRRGPTHLLEAKMLPALFADRRISARRLALGVAALGTRHEQLLLFHGWPSNRPGRPPCPRITANAVWLPPEGGLRVDGQRARGQPCSD